MSPTIATKPLLKKDIIYCPIFGSSYLRRVRRVGFKQRVILSMFGYYPWECGRCKEPLSIRKRYGSHRSPHPEHQD